MTDFKNIDYLSIGNERQRQAYRDLIDLNIFNLLKEFNPILAGTIPIEIDLPESDLDIICECKDHSEFSKVLTTHFSEKDGFEIKLYDRNGIETTLVRFNTRSFVIEIFGQNIPTHKQNAYRHMLIENKILNQKGAEFRSRVIALKSSGLKTEPAFAKLLGLKGDPYDELLRIKID